METISVRIEFAEEVATGDKYALEDLILDILLKFNYSVLSVKVDS